MNNHSNEVFIHRVKEVKYIESNYITLREAGVPYAEQMEDLSEQVNEAIREGWEPMGKPIYAGRDSDVPDLIQMMAKR